MTHLPVNEKGYPVPFFVAKIDGKYDFRVADPVKLSRCLNSDVCWICGEPLGRYKVFIVGPVASITGMSAEPPMHLDCAIFAVKACPFLLLPKAQRREVGLPEEKKTLGGEMLLHNPGISVVWITHHFRPVNDGAGGLLIELGTPERLEYYCEGRPATREECIDAFKIGVPELTKRLRSHREALELQKAVARALARLPL